MHLQSFQAITALLPFLRGIQPVSTKKPHSAPNDYFALKKILSNTTYFD